LLSHGLNQPKTWVLTHQEYQLSPVEQHTLIKITEQVKQGMPLPYIIGEWPFFGRSFMVTPHVLIPRPETELLVEKAIEHSAKFENPKIIDIGTGTGNIAISLACELRNAKITAVDISLFALKTAKKNAKKHQQEHIHFVQADLLQPFTGIYNLICANLPYIPSGILNTLEVRKQEPILALDGGVDGLKFIRSLLKQATQKLSRPGIILLEIESTTGELARITAKRAFPKAEINLLRDLAGHDRVIEIIQA
jgi:release factor glutamine methyltransferase